MKLRNYIFITACVLAFAMSVMSYTSAASCSPPSQRVENEKRFDFYTDGQCYSFESEEQIDLQQEKYIVSADSAKLITLDFALIVYYVSPQGNRLQQTNIYKKGSTKPIKNAIFRLPRGQPISPDQIYF